MALHIRHVLSKLYVRSHRYTSQLGTKSDDVELSAICRSTPMLFVNVSFVYDKRAWAHTIITARKQNCGR